MCFLYFNSHRKEIESLEMKKSSLQKEVIIVNSPPPPRTATFVLDIETNNLMDHLKTSNKEIS